MFRRPAVRRVLYKGFVEARLHTDFGVNIERIRELQAELADGNVANPYYVIVDPDTGRKLRSFPGGTLREKAWLEFLEKTVRVGRK